MLMGPGTALPAETQSSIINSTESVSIDSEFPTNTKIAMLPAKNYPFNVHVAGDQPGVFTYVDFEDNQIGTKTFSTTNEKGYPTSLGTLEETWGVDPLENPWAVEWLDISNNDIESGETASYNLSLSSVQLGSLNVGAKTGFDTFIMSDYRELELIVGAPGLYIFYYEADTTLNSPHLINKNGTEIGFTAENLLPLLADGMGGGTTIRKFAYFWADYAGSYTLFFKTTTRYVTFELVGITDITDLDIGDRVIYQDSNSEEIDPSTLMSESAYFPIQLYSFPVSTGQYLRFNYAEIWGSPMSFLLLPSISGYQMDTIATDGTDTFIPISEDGTAYFAVLHNQYFNTLWNIPLYYNFAVYNDEIPTYQYELGNTSLYSVDPTFQRAIIQFNVTGTEPTSVLLNYTIHQGGAGVYDPANDFFYLSDETGYLKINAPIASGSVSDYYYDLVPGIYRLFIHSTSKLQTDVVEFQSYILDRDEITSKHHTKINDYILKSDMSQLTSAPFYDTSTYTVNYPSTRSFEYDDSIRFGYNVSIYPADNPLIFDRVMDVSDTQVWIWNGTEYLNQTTSGSALDLFVNGSATSHYVYFGCDQQVDSMAFNLVNVSSSTGNYTWQWLDNDSDNDWTNMNILSDGTNTTGGTLGQSGKINFDYPQVFTEFNKVSDPDWGGAMPDVNKSMYWYRLRCLVPSPSSIPALAPHNSASPKVQMYPYTNLYVKVNSEINLISKFDNMTKLQKETKDYTLNLDGFDEFDSQDYIYLELSDNGLFGSGDALWSIWPYQVYDRTYDESTSTYTNVPITKEVKFRIVTFDDVARYETETYPSIGSSPIDLSELDFEDYNTYGFSGSYNESHHDGVIVSVEGNLYDWYQFVFQSTNTQNPISAGLIFDNIWLDNTGPVMSNVYPLFSGNVNDSIELGIAPSSFKFIFVAADVNTSEYVQYRLNIASYGVQLLTPNLTLSSTQDDVTKVPSWVLPVSIGGGVAIIAIIGGVVVYKKKNPI